MKNVLSVSKICKFIRQTNVIIGFKVNNKTKMKRAEKKIAANELAFFSSSSSRLAAVAVNVLNFLFIREANALDSI